MLAKHKILLSMKTFSWENGTIYITYLTPFVQSWPFFLGFHYMHICTRCGRAYKYKASLYNHTTYECGQEKQFRCEICNYHTKRKGNLKKHINIRHAGNPDSLDDWVNLFDSLFSTFYNKMYLSYLIFFFDQ